MSTTSRDENPGSFRVHPEERECTLGLVRLSDSDSTWPGNHRQIVAGPGSKRMSSNFVPDDNDYGRRTISRGTAVRKEKHGPFDGPSVCLLTFQDSWTSTDSWARDQLPVGHLEVPPQLLLVNRAFPVTPASRKTALDHVFGIIPWIWQN
jgi:hypothetical protein